MRSNTDISQSGESQQPWFRIYAQATQFDDLADLTAQLGQADFGVLVLYVAPTAVVAAALAQGQSAAEAVAGWSAECDALLTIQRKYRSQMVVMEQPAIDSARKAAQAALADRLPDVAMPQEDLLADVSPDLAMYQALAGLALGHDARALALVDALQAASLGPYGDQPTASALIESLLTDQRAILRLQNAQSVDLQAVTVERDAQTAKADGFEKRAVDLALQLNVVAKQVVSLEAQSVGLQAVAVERDAQTAKASDFEKRAADLAMQLNAAAKKVVSLEAQSVVLQDVAVERGTQAAKAGDVQKRTAALQLEAAAKQVVSLEAQSIGLQAVAVDRDAQAVKAGDFEKQTADLNLQLQTAAKREADQQQAARQMEAVMVQQIAALEQALKTLQSDHSQTQTERREMDRSYRQQLAELTAMLDAVHASTTWRVMGPARSVMRRIRR